MILHEYFMMPHEYFMILHETLFHENFMILHAKFMILHAKFMILHEWAKSPRTRTTFKLYGPLPCVSRSKSLAEKCKDESMSHYQNFLNKRPINPLKSNSHFSKVVTVKMKSYFAIFAIIAIANAQERLVPRQLDEFATNTMRENGELRAVAPECKGQLG